MVIVRDKNTRANRSVGSTPTWYIAIMAKTEVYKDMKQILFAMVFALFLAGAAFSAVNIDTLAIYDINGDGVIDAEERIALDIDIEGCRVSFDESAYADMLTTDDTIILNEEIQGVALYHNDIRNDAVVITTPVPDTEPIVTEYIVNEHDDNGEVVPEDIPTHSNDTSNDTPAFTCICAVAGLLAVGYVITRYREK